MIIDTSKIMYEDELPEMTQNEYDIWYDISWVDGVRLGFHVSDTEKQLENAWEDCLKSKQQIE